MDKLERMQKDKLEKQLISAHGKVEYTYTAHHKIQNRYEGYDKLIRTSQIVLTAASTGGFLATIITNHIFLSWIGGAFAAISLALNLYSKDFQPQLESRKHKDAADDLWIIKNKYESLITDIDGLSLEVVRERRNEIQLEIDEINRKYPATDPRGYRKAQKALQEEEEQTFSEGEAEKFLP